MQIVHADTITNSATGQGYAKYDPAEFWHIGAAQIRLNQQQQSTLVRSGLLRKVVYNIPKAACSRWGTVALTEGKTKQIDQLNKALLSIPVVDHRYRRQKGGFKTAIRMALGLAFKTGNGAIILDVDDGKPIHEPIDYGNLQKIRRLRVLSRWRITPYVFGNVAASGYTHYQIFGSSLMGFQDTMEAMGQMIHRSRVIWLSGVDDDDEFSQDPFSGLGCDLSILDLVVDAFLDYLGGHKGAVRMLSDFDVIVHYIKGFSDMVQADCDGTSDDARTLLAHTAARNNRTRSMFRGYLADMDEEKIDHITRQTGGYGDLLDRTKAFLQANTEYPPAVLFGEFSSGIDSSGKSQEEMTLWNNTIADAQQDKLQPHFEGFEPESMGILGLVMSQKQGPTKGKILEGVGWDWQLLYEPTPTQNADLKQKHAQIIQTIGQSDPRFVSNAILSHYGGETYNPEITLTPEYRAQLEKEAKLEEPPGGQQAQEEQPAEGEEFEGDEEGFNEADGGTEDDPDLSEFEEFLAQGSGESEPQAQNDSLDSDGSDRTDTDDDILSQEDWDLMAQYGSAEKAALDDSWKD